MGGSVLLAASPLNGAGGEKGLNGRTGTNKKALARRAFLFQRESGTDLLSRGIPRTIIGAAPFHGPVRDGKAWFQSALGTRHSLSSRCSHNETNSKEVGWDCIAKHVTVELCSRL